MTFGLLNIDKPAGWTSHDVVNRVRRSTGVKKVGHAGTLDPTATGVLVLCLGKATRLSEYIMGHTKTYQAIVRFGATSTTYDAQGEITPSSEAMPFSRVELEAQLSGFTGHIQQVPPMYSAIKQGGEKLYEKARRGEEVERAAREVTIYKLTLESFVYPEAIITVRCSPGTYIRSVAHDLGQVMGQGAYLDGLVRTASGDNFTLSNAVPWRQLEADIAAGTWQTHIMSVRAGLSQLPYIELNNQQAATVRQGGPLQLGISNRGPVQVWTHDGDFVGIMAREGEADDQAVWRPEKVFGAD